MHNFKNKTFFENNFACAKGPSCLSDVRVPRYGQAARLHYTNVSVWDISRFIDLQSKNTCYQEVA